jgi:GTPase SAR1 family protein
MVFGQLVIGPPGSGKTTYCNGMSQFLQLIGRKTAVINLDPANDQLPYECAVNIEELIKLEDVMAQYDLGPNGGALSFCLSVSVFQLENANPNSLNSDKKKEVSHVLALRVQTELRPLAR